MEPTPQRSLLYSTVAIIVCVFMGAFACFGFAFTLEEDQGGYAFLLGLLSLFMAVILILLIIDLMRTGGYSTAPRRSFRASLLKIILRSLFWIPLGAILVLLILLIGSVPPGLGVILTLGTLVAIGITAAQLSGILRRRRKQSILEYLEQATSLNLPLSRMMHAAAEGETGTLHYRLRALAIELEAGTTLSAALEDSVPEIGRQTLGIAAAERIGQLPHMLNRMIRKPQQDDAYVTGIDIFYREYAMIYLLLVLFVAMMSTIVIFPKFRSIANDFHVQLPSVFFFANEYVVPIFSVIAGIIVLTALVLWIGRPLYPALARTSVGHWGADLFARFVGSIPILGGFLRDRGMADLCDFLAVALESGVPLDIALTESAAAQPNILLQHRAAAWAGEISRGQPLAQAASAAGMPPLLVGMLPATTDSDSLAAVMRFLAGHFELRWLRAQAIIQSFYIPILVFLMGSAVAIMAMSIFQPLGRLNEAAAHFPSGF